MPFRHVVMFRWADHVDADHVDQVRMRLDELPGQIEQLRSYVHGSDVGVSEGNYDYTIVADLDDVQAFRTYRDHPSHVLFVEELIKGYVAGRAAVQFTTPTPDELAQRTAVGAITADPESEDDDELLERARRAAAAEMQALLAEPDDIG